MKSNDKDFGYSIPFKFQCPKCSKEVEMLSIDHRISNEAIIISLCKKCNIKWRITFKVEKVSLMDDTINRINKFKG